MRKSRKIFLIGAIIYVLVMVAIYLGVSVYFMKHFFPGSVINGINCASKTVEEVEDLIANKVQDYTITIKGMDGRKEEISGARMDFRYVSAGQIQKLKDSQNPVTWIYAYFNPQTYSMVAKTTYNKEALKSSMEKLSFFATDSVVKPQDASIVEAGTGYRIQEQIEGNELDAGKVFELLKAAVDKGDKEIDLVKNDCYLKPAVYGNDENLNKRLSILNQYAQMTVTYEFGEDQEVIDSAMIHQWMTLDGQGNITFDSEAVNQYVENLGDKYDTLGKMQPFHTSLGEDVTVESITYGWQMDRDSEREKLMQVLNAGESTSIDPVYLESASVRGENDIGDTYVEIDYTSQHMWYYKNGKLLVETDVVTGNPNKGNASPVGLFCLTGKERNATLVGEDYRTPVSYWMPYYDGVGIHDANWQPVFGGDRYKTFGSHGCINTPINLVAMIYDNIEVGTPIVCYEGTILPKPGTTTPAPETNQTENKEDSKDQPSSDSEKDTKETDKTPETVPPDVQDEAEIPGAPEGAIPQGL